MVLVADADDAAFEVLYDRHIGVIYALAYRVCGQRSGADDVVQEAMLAVWRSADRYQAHLGSVRSWMLTIVHHRAIDMLRRQTRLDDHQVDDVQGAEGLAGGADPLASVLEGEQHDLATHALAGLPEAQRRVLLLSFYGGYTQAEIAEMLQEPLGTVKSRMRLALSHMRDRSEELAHV